jgi:RNA polymerase sigma-70 factor (ECF subfamily)
MADQPTDNLLERLQKGDQAAAAGLFRRYVDRLIALARSRLRGAMAGRVDPEDVVQSAYRSFFCRLGGRRL